MPSPDIFNLSPLFFICAGDSSPEIYKTSPYSLYELATCKSKVDFPIPGFPVTKTTSPFKSPPPSNLSNSSYFVLYLSSLVYSTSLNS